MKVEHPGLALLIVFVIAAALNLYGLHDGSLYLWDLIGGVFIYKLLTARPR